MIELALPAGSLQAALHAFEGGADAVYLGLKQYSARKHATNFSIEELAALKQEAIRLRKHVYITLNTLLDDDELSSTIPLLRRLELLRPDGIIVQDLGLASLIVREFPTLGVHASTQMAVHTVAGVRELQRLGFSRIVLSRELTFNQIKSIRKACPDADLKVFIHGAMCYGFSGLCMASKHITGRSANRGECAQICRTWFTHLDEGSGQHNGYFFSMTDLAVGQDVLRLRDIGINSLKIEGRMKSPAYVRFAARYYRMILDGETDRDALRIAREELDAQFARESQGGWLFGYGKEKPSEMRHTPSLTTLGYPSHQGTQIGTVCDQKPGTRASGLSVSLSSDISVRDGLMVLQEESNGMQQPIKFPLVSIRLADGHSSYIGKAGTTVHIEIPPEAIVRRGTAVYRVSRSDLNVQELNESGLSPFRYPLDLNITITHDSMVLCTKSLPKWAGGSFCQSYPLDIQMAKSVQKTVQNLQQIFSSPGEGFATLGKLFFENHTAWRDEQVFMPLSRLKEIRRSWYASLQELMEVSLSSPVEPETCSTQTGLTLPHRVRINPLTDTHIPWADPIRLEKQLSHGSDIGSILSSVDGWYYLPLPPVMFDEEALFDALDRLMDTHPHMIRVGLNNIAQIGWARRHPEIACFADIYLYMTNREAALALSLSVPSLIGMYHWVERNSMDTNRWPMTGSPTGPGFTVPLFISRNCFRYDSLGLPCEGCPRHGSWDVAQNGHQYRVDVRECVTIVSEQPEQQ